ncbi:MAG: hypothetical protein QXP38_00160 [Nitrososphaerota archaeon]
MNTEEKQDLIACTVSGNLLASEGIMIYSAITGAFNLFATIYFVSSLAIFAFVNLLILPMLEPFDWLLEEYEEDE